MLTETAPAVVARCCDVEIVHHKLALCPIYIIAFADGNIMLHSHALRCGVPMNEESVRAARAGTQILDFRLV